MINNNNTNNNFEIPLQLSNKLKDEGIIQKFVKNQKHKYIKIELNHKYEQSNVIITTVNIKNWNKFLELVKKELKFKGIDDQHIRLIIEIFDENHELVSGINDNDEDNKYNEEGKENKKSLPQILVEFVLQNCVVLFKDEFNVPHIKLQNHYGVLPINNTKFKYYLLNLYYDAHEGQIANMESINSAISQLEAKAMVKGKTIPLHLRVAWSNNETTDAIYYDLSDEKNRCVKITKDGWKIEENQDEVLFKRYDHLKPQVEPIKKQ